jgi:Fungal specific transcription factor domain
LNSNIDELGVKYFFHHFVISGRSNSRGYLNYIPSVYHADGEQSTLMASMAAVGLVALANSTRRPELASHARAKYLEAIRNVNAALASSVESVKDSTLMSVISLGVFEHVSGHESWVRHVQGAGALVAARGKSQFSSPVAILMFNQVRTDLVISCFHSATSFPDNVLELQEEAAKHADTSSSWWIMGLLGTRCAQILTNVRKNSIAEEIAWYGLLNEVIELERDFENLEGILAIQEPYTTRVSDGDPKITYNGLYAVNKDSWAIRLWANLRTLQMVTCEIICYIVIKILAEDLAPAVREHMKLRLQNTLQTLSKQGNDILAIVPQALEFITSAPEPCPFIGLSFQGSVTGGYMLAWALFMVGKSPATESKIRKWVIRLLQDIGRNTGMSIALKLVEAAIKMDKTTS